jgi:type I restriction enzyme S subunit
MKRYDNYKDSGIEWIGEIPSHWESWKISHAFNRIGSGTTPESGNPIYHENGTVNWLNTGDLNDGFLDSCSKQITQKALEDYSSLKLFPAGSLVMAMYGATIGKTAILNFETTTNQACCVFCESEIINLRFLQYWFIGNKEQIINLAIGGGQPNISQNILKDIRLWCPDYSEQLSLNNYLDHKTSQIDDLIAKKERLIQLLDEERTTIINQAVTKGLDPTVPMKDSGIEWLGEIPAHWEVAKFNLYVSIRHGHQFMNHDFTDDGVKVVKITQLHKDGYLDLSKCSYVSSEQLENYQSILIKEKDILMCLTGGTIGKIIRVGEVNEPLLQNYRVGHFSSGNVSKISDDFIFWLMSSESIVSQIFFQMRETGQPNIGMDDFGRMRITIPPLMEQEKIVKHIVNKTAEISEILIKSKQEIELLKEYKTALISEVVSGKVDVRDEKLN